MAVPLVARKFYPAFFGAGFIAGIKEWTAVANLAIFITDFLPGLLMLYLYIKVKIKRACVR